MPPPQTPSPLEIIALEFGRPEDDSYFRILAGTRVKDVVIRPNTLDREHLGDMPLNFQNILPPLPYGEDSDAWTVAEITRDEDGSLRAALSTPTKARVETVWHPRLVNFLHLRRVEQRTLLVRECTWSEQPQPTVMAKMARFEWEMPYIEKETRAYRMLEGAGLAPRFLGHIHEEGRVVGVLLEKVEGRPAGPEDLDVCVVSLRRLHGLGILHGDCNRHNFIVGRDGQAALVDFEKSRIDADQAAMEAEVGGLKGQLADDSGRGGGFGAVEGG